MVDKYTKWMLTIIATALVVIAADDITHVALAQIGLPGFRSAMSGTAPS